MAKQGFTSVKIMRFANDPYTPTYRLMDAKTKKTLQELKQKVDGLVAAGQLTEAIHAATDHIEKCEELLGTDPESMLAHAEALETRADLLRQSNADEQACDDYIQAIEKLDKRDDCLIPLGRLHAGLGAAYAALDESESAARQWERSISCFEKNDPPSPLDVAAMANNFGFLKKAAGEYDAAENAFLKALEILHSELGERHEETATVASNLGMLYQEAGHYEPARKMHVIAAEARSTIFGDNHPDTARSNSDLGIALSKTGNRTAARKFLERAVHAYDALGREFHGDLEIVARQYGAVLKEDGELSMAEAVAKRVRDLIGKKAKA